MAKTNTKRKDANVSIKRRLTAALVMLLISSIMLVSTTYAWLTLSVSPEARGIDTSIAGNGSLEIALVPATGALNSIGTGRGASSDAAGNTIVTANNNWGNIVNLTPVSYGLGHVTLAPAMLNVQQTFTRAATNAPVTGTHGDAYYEGDAIVYYYVGSSYTDSNSVTVNGGDYTNASGNKVATPAAFIYSTNGTDFVDAAGDPVTPAGTVSKVLTTVVNSAAVDTAEPFKVPKYGYDGRIMMLEETSLGSYNDQAANVADYYNGTDYGVRVIVDDAGNTYGYVVDLAFRVNAANANGSPAKLMLQSTAVQRVSGSTAASTQGHGSTISFQKVTDSATTEVDPAVPEAAAYLGAIKVAFVENLGQTGGEASVLAYAKADADGNLHVCDASGTVLTGDDAEVILSEMTAGEVYQISAVVWIDGSSVTNANYAVSTEVLNNTTVNLQFTTDVTLAVNSIANTLG